MYQPEVLKSWRKIHLMVTNKVNKKVLLLLSILFIIYTTKLLIYKKKIYI